DRLEQQQHFVRLAAVGEGDHHVVALDHAEIAVAGLGGMQKDRSGSGAGERGGNFPADDPGLAPPRQDYASAAVTEQAHPPVPPLAPATAHPPGTPPPPLPPPP